VNNKSCKFEGKGEGKIVINNLFINDNHNIYSGSVSYNHGPIYQPKYNKRSDKFLKGFNFLK
jgi:hypothetical protein